MAESRMEKHASHSHSAIREDISVTADIPRQLPPPSPVVVSTRSLGTEYVEHRPPDPTHIPYDIV